MYKFIGVMQEVKGRSLNEIAFKIMNDEGIKFHDLEEPWDMIKYDSPIYFVIRESYNKYMLINNMVYKYKFTRLRKDDREETAVVNSSGAIEFIVTSCNKDIYSSLYFLIRKKIEDSYFTKPSYCPSCGTEAEYSYEESKKYLPAIEVHRLICKTCKMGVGIANQYKEDIYVSFEDRERRSNNQIGQRKFLKQLSKIEIGSKITYVGKLDEYIVNNHRDPNKVILVNEHGDFIVEDKYKTVSLIELVD